MQSAFVILRSLLKAPSSHLSEAGNEGTQKVLPHQVSFSALICGYVLPTSLDINRSLVSSKILAGFEIQCQWVICLPWHCLAKKILFGKRHIFLGPDSKTLLLTGTCPCEIHWYSTN